MVNEAHDLPGTEAVEPENGLILRLWLVPNAVEMATGRGLERDV